MNQKVKVGIIGFGRMGGFYLEEMRKSDQWEVLYICDTDPEARDLARRKSPTSRIVADEQVVFEDPEVQVVGLFTLADSRLRQIKKAMAFGKHVISEKPVADTMGDYPERLPDQLLPRIMAKRKKTKGHTSPFGTYAPF